MVTTEIRIFAYLSNYVLLAVFIGSGIGMLWPHKISILWTSTVMTIIMFGLTIDFIIHLPGIEFQVFKGTTELLSPLSDSYIWLQTGSFSLPKVVIGIILTIFLFFLLSLMFLPPGKYLGDSLNKIQRPLIGYSINILASLLGVWCFYILSLLGISPYVGLVIGQGFLIFLLQTNRERLVGVVILCILSALLYNQSRNIQKSDDKTIWSPYQKLTLSNIGTPPISYRPEGWGVYVNNTGYMGLFDLSSRALQEKATEIKRFFSSDTSEALFSNHYQLPYIFNPTSVNVLIIGGGGGNDAAAAIRANIKKIDVVEIDPAIIALGKVYHPEHPYSSPFVSTYISDGRNYLETTRKTYDLIVMGLADSHTVGSSFTNVQLDNYLYTKEALIKAKEKLNKDGLLFITFEVQKPWIGQHLFKTLRLAFGYDPVVFEVRSDGIYGWGGSMFAIGKQADTIVKILEKNAELHHFVQKHALDYSGNDVNVLTDNWPYIYLNKPSVPILHIILSVLFLGIVYLLIRTFTNLERVEPNFFFMGVGFVLLEFQNISKASLLIGNTWVTNVLIISGVLLFVLIGNVMIGKKTISLRQGLSGLFFFLVLQLIFPLSWFSKFPYVFKISGALIFLTIPHIFSSVVFAGLYQSQKNKATAMGSNLIGSAVGGFLEMLAYQWGMTSLILLVIFAYGVGTWKLLRR